MPWVEWSFEYRTRNSELWSSLIEAPVRLRHSAVPGRLHPVLIQNRLIRLYNLPKGKASIRVRSCPDRAPVPAVLLLPHTEDPGANRDIRQHR